MKNASNRMYWYCVMWILAVYIEPYAGSHGESVFFLFLDG